MEHQRDPKRARTSDPPAAGDDGGGIVDAREPLLPDDLLLEIAARADVATVVRCAAPSKPLRRAILGPGFRHQLGPGHAVLLGFSFQPHGSRCRICWVNPMTQNPIHDWIQTFSSKNGRWSAVRSVSYPEQVCLVSRAHPAVIGRLVHWLYPGRLSNPHRVLAVDVDAAAATTMQLPPSYRSRMRAVDDREAYVRLVAVGGKLSLIVGETTAVSMWTLTASTWSRQVVIGMQELERRAGLRPDMYYFCQTLFLGFAEASGTVAVLMMERHLLTLNLGTKAVTTLWRGGRENRAWASQVCLHEIGLASALQAMKSF
ncbi:unnamed protein product [Urochloa decumbens]|uniref:DUF7595 domain-containing protein n=1 Tax=Urochloa decumbens TaxID=240449 RepID=A0ABC9D470_9POAL